MSKFGQFRVTITQSTLYVEPLNDECDVDGAWEACGAIFGIASMCRCRACEKDLDAIFRTVVEYLGDELSLQKSFKVESKRSDKRFPLNSIQISQEDRRQNRRGIPECCGRCPQPVVCRQHRGPRNGCLRPRSGNARRGRSSHRHGRARGGAAVGRHRLSGCGLYDCQARRGD